MLEITAMIVIVQVLPVMLAARMLEAGRAGFLRRLFVMLMLGILTVAGDQFVEDVWIGSVVSAALGSLLIAGLLDTSILKGFGIGVIVVLIKVLVLIAYFEYLVASMTVDPAAA